MLELNVDQAINFLDVLDPNARHTIASEAPFGDRNGGPKWEQGATYEPELREDLIKDIQKRQARKSNVYYSVNRPCSASDQQGSYGKNSVDDIIGIRALAFDIDFFTDAELISTKLAGEFKPSIIVNTGGGLHLIYLLNEVINVNLYRLSPNDEQERINILLRDTRASVTQLAQDFEALLRSIFPKLKIDNMSNVDRVMRLPGTVNYPKAEKRAKGQVEALAHIAIDNRIKCDPRQLRLHVPRLVPPRRPMQKFDTPKDSQWPPYRKAMTLCVFIRENGLADTNEIYTKRVMLPLMGMIHDENENNRITLEEAEECFMEAVSGGERYGSVGRGAAHFKRQWRSHHPEQARRGAQSIGSLVKFCKDHGMQLPWSTSVVAWEQDFQRQRQELQELNTKLSDHDVIDLGSFINAKR